MTQPPPAATPDTDVVAALHALTTAITNLTAAITAGATPTANQPPAGAGWTVCFPRDTGRKPTVFPLQADAERHADRHGGQVVPPRTPILDPRRWATEPAADDGQAA